ncbi:class I SAM-dependent methyltransferase [Nocardioides sp. MH1]|uniref:class I SAM-dependent methyltransferase n=1 Tax=Nocardioides sp. MH1 TaxID=3242490 RepID=UPI00352299D9
MPDRSWVNDASKSYDRVAIPYAELVRDGFKELPLERAILDLFTSQVRASAQAPVLDAGCGPGVLSRELVESGLPVTAIDVSPRMLQLARMVDARLHLAVASLTSLPFATGTFAGVFCWYVLHHVPDHDLAQVVSELARVTAPGGSLMLGGHVGEGSYVKTEGYGGLPMRVLFTRRSALAYAAALRTAGLVVDATTTLGPDDPAKGAIWLAHKPS